MKTVITLVGLLFLTACPRDSQVASINLSRAADNFEIPRRVVFFNGITDTYLLEIQGFCSIKDQRDQLEVICKTKHGYKKHFLGLSDNVSYFAEQLTGVRVSTQHYKVLFKPSVIVPDIELN